MTNRRMFSHRIINSARFLQMPAESQMLYFHLGMRADDDGVVEAYPIIKVLGVAPDTIKVLIIKNFIKQLNEDQVCFITDWDEHNTIRADRKINSIYKPLLDEIGVKTLAPKPRLDVKNNSQRVVDCPRTTNGRHRLGKVKLGKVKLSKVNVSESLPQELEKYTEKYGKEMINKFLLYWTQKNKNGKKELWQMQRVFDIPKRLATWHGKEWNSTKKDSIIILHDGTKAIKKFRIWVCADDPNIRINRQYYPELKNYE